MRFKAPLSAILVGVAALLFACQRAPEPPAGPAEGPPPEAPSAAAAQPPPHLEAEGRGDRVLALRPGAMLPDLTPENLFAEWTQRQVERWKQSHPVDTEEAAISRAADEAALLADFPTRIAPYGKVRSGTPPNKEMAMRVLASGPPQNWRAYCPFCASMSMTFQFSEGRPMRAKTSCCQTELREEGFPEGHPLHATETTQIPDLDGNMLDVPTTIYKDKHGVEWELYIPMVFANKRWHDSFMRGEQYLKEYTESADPAHVVRLAMLLDKTADTYHGLLPSYINELAKGKDGKPLTREEWEAVPRPNYSQPAPGLGQWNRRSPMSNHGWLQLFKEARWANLFAKVRHHPAFRAYSRKVHGDPDALDKKIRRQLIREIVMSWEAINVSGLMVNYQDSLYLDELLAGILAENAAMREFASVGTEAAFYNHVRSDGLLGEGAANYMPMPAKQLIKGVGDPAGLISQFAPDFKEQNPFFDFGTTEFENLRTMRGLALEFGDEHVYAYGGWKKEIFDNPEEVARREALPSRNWPDYGVGLLRVGGPGSRMEVSLIYTRVRLHSAADPLGITCAVDGFPVMRAGGYAAPGWYRQLQWGRPEIDALQTMGYPREIAEAKPNHMAFLGWTHSPTAQNTISVDETFPSPGWQPAGYGEPLVFAAGETGGDAPPVFQVLEARDRYSFETVGRPIEEFRRALLGVEWPDRRAYVVDISTMRGAGRFALFNSAWADRAGETLPAETGRKASLREALVPEGSSVGEIEGRVLGFGRHVREHGRPGGMYDVVWETDAAAYAPRDPKGQPIKRPLPEPLGRVGARFIGLPDGRQETGLLSAKGPWVALTRQPLPNGDILMTNLAFLDGTDLLVETNTATMENPTTRFIHVIEGLVGNQSSAIASARLLPLPAPAADHAVAIEIVNTDGWKDFVLYQDASGTAEFAGFSSDARFAMVRLAPDGRPAEARMIEGSFVRGGGVSLEGPARFEGTLVDMAGDLTGTRSESALIILPDSPWPEFSANQTMEVSVEGPNPLRAPVREAYNISGITKVDGGLLRLDLANTPPLSLGWYQVSQTMEGNPAGFLTITPILRGSHTRYANGAMAYFPRLNKTLRLKKLSGGFHNSSNAEFDVADWRAEGVEPGDWFLLHLLEPGQRVSLPNAVAWKAPPRQLSLSPLSPANSHTNP